TPETSKAVLEKAFKLGYRLSGPESNFIEACFLFFHNFHSITFSKKLDMYIEHSFEEITAAEILAMEEPEETFEVFQKVLIRSSNDGKWQPAFYSRYDPNDTYSHQTISGHCAKQCIDYEKNKHLVFTTDK